MIKEKDLMPLYNETRFKDGDNVTLERVASAIVSAVEDEGLPIATKVETVKVGNLFSSHEEECICLYHPEHESDYLKTCIRIRRQGKSAYISTYQYGMSVLLGKEAAFERSKEKASTPHASDAAWLGYGIQSLSKAIGGSKRKQALQDETDWYGIVNNAIVELLNI